LLTHYFVWELGAREDVGKFLEGEVFGRWSRPFIGNVDGLENGTYGREFFEKMDGRLMDRVPRFKRSL
jgi:hypothetical protein